MDAIIAPNDPRLCQSFTIGLLREGTAVSVGLYLKPTGSEEIRAIHVNTPAEARGLAFKLWEAAEMADRAMNEAVTVVKPVYGHCDGCQAHGVELIVRPGEQSTICRACEQNRRDAEAQREGA